MPGLAWVGHHQVARHPVAVHGHHRLRERALHQQVGHAVPVALLRFGPGDAELARHAPFGEQRQLAPQQRFVVGGQFSRRHGRLEPHQRAQGVAHQAVGLRGSGLAQGVQVERVAQVGEQQEALRGVAGQHPRRMQTGAVDEAGHLHEGAHVLLRRRRVHHDERAGAGLHAEVAPEAGVGRGRLQRGGLEGVLRSQAFEPAGEGGFAGGVGPGNGRSIGRRRRGGGTVDPHG